MFKNRFMARFDFNEYNSLNEPCIFFGVYTDEDLALIMNHKDLKIIIFGGSDINLDQNHNKNTIDLLKTVDNIIFISISECIYTRLKSIQINSIYYILNLVDKNLFKYVDGSKKSNTIYIYNGQIEGREYLYGKKYYDMVILKLNSNGYTFNYIYSNKLNINHENMPEIYNKCFVMLRLTKYDGNANSVQECEAMKIPVIHNQSNYGLKWKNAEDICNMICKLYNDQDP